MSEFAPTTLDDLIQIEAIKNLKHRYMRCLDQKRFEEMREIFTPDATARYSGGRYSFNGIEEIIGFLNESMSSEDFLSSHRCVHPEIQLSNDRHATGIWAFDDTVVMMDYGLRLRGAGFYSDEYVRTDDGWRIAHTGYKRTFEEVLPRSSIDGLKLTASFWATGGRSTL